MLTFLRKYKRRFRDFFDETSFKLSRIRKTPTSKILMYHGIDSCNSLKHNFRHIGVKYFEKHLICLKQHFNVVSLENYFNGNVINSKPNCAITFDDGYLNNLIYALPILEKHTCPATIFITTIEEKNVDFLWSDMLDLMVPYLPNTIELDGEEFHKNKNRWYQPFISSSGENLHTRIKTKRFYQKMDFFNQYQSIVDDIKKNPKLTDYWQLINHSQWQTIANSPYISIGSHTVTHSNIGLLNKKAVEFELKNSKSILEKFTNQKISALAYPDGSYQPRDITLANSYGYQYQLAVRYLSSKDENDPRILCRDGLYAYQSLKQQYSTIMA